MKYCAGEVRNDADVTEGFAGVLIPDTRTLLAQVAVRPIPLHNVVEINDAPPVSGAEVPIRNVILEGRRYGGLDGDEHTVVTVGGLGVEMIDGLRSAERHGIVMFAKANVKALWWRYVKAYAQMVLRGPNPSAVPHRDRSWYTW